MAKDLSTDPYKGTRDFYPEDMAVQRYIFDTWAKTAESFGFERYDASILEPSELYKSKGAENEELVNEQTYTFIDRGDREVTLRPEMTPTVARMIAATRNKYTFPIRWYSIPNLFRYERPQRGRLREHWQLNCDMFGVDHYSADVEMIALAHQTLIAFGATDSDFEIRINNRQLMTEYFTQRYGISDKSILSQITNTLDKKKKIAEKEFKGELFPIFQDKYDTFRKELELDINEFVQLINAELQNSTLILVKNALKELGIKVVFDATLARGFTYYTGTIFEIFDTSSKNNRSLIGGGRYDNLTSLFGGEPITGMGFGMGDVTMRDFLETHKLINDKIRPTFPTLILIPTDVTFNIESEKLAQAFRKAGVRVAVDISERSINTKFESARKNGAKYTIHCDATLLTKAKILLMKDLEKYKDVQGHIDELIKTILSK